MFCSKCGVVVPEAGRFCIKCGTSVEAATATVPVSPTKKPKAVTQLVGWLLFGAGVVLALWSTPVAVLSAVPLWVGAALALPGRSIIIRAGNGLVAACVVGLAIWQLVPSEARFSLSEGELASADAVHAATQSSSPAVSLVAPQPPPEPASAPAGEEVSPSGAPNVSAAEAGSAAAVEVAPAPVATPPPSAIGPSFDCGKASTSVEKLICSNAELGSLDGELSKAYREMLQRPAFDADAVRSEQRKWLLDRGKCADVICLTDMYKKRLASIQDGLDRT